MTVVFIRGGADKYGMEGSLENKSEFGERPYVSRQNGRIVLLPFAMREDKGGQCGRELFRAVPAYILVFAFFSLLVVAF